MPSKLDKGKHKATSDPSETTPLLPSSLPSSSTLPAQTTPPVNRLTPQRTSFLRTHALTITLTLTTTLLALCLGLILVLYSFVPSEADRPGLEKAVLWRGPEGISVVNVSLTGIWVKIDGSLSIDTDLALGLRPSGVRIGESEDQDGDGRGHNSEWFESIRTTVGHSLINFLGPLSITLPQTASLHSTLPPSTFSSETSPTLLTFSLPCPLPIPFSPSSPSHNSSTKVSFLVHVEPLLHPGRLLALAQDAWKTGWVEVLLEVPEVRVGRWRGLAGWKGWAVRDLKVPLEFDVDGIPGLPSRETNLSNLISLKSYSFRTLTTNTTAPANSTGSSRLAVEAHAEVPNLLEGVKGRMGYELGFGVYLRAPGAPAEGGGEGGAGEVARLRREGKRFKKSRKWVAGGLVKMAEVVTLPIDLHGQKTIGLEIQGFFTSDLEVPEEGNGTETALSGFLRRYLDGEDNEVVVRGLPYLPPTISDGHPPPGWIQQVLPSINVSVIFPGPKPKPKLIRSVTIENMKISQKGQKMVASGVVIAQIELPKDMSSIEVDVDGVLPDVLVFDGAVPDEDGDLDPDETPYPLRAFGRIHPLEYLPSQSERSTDPADLGILIVRAPLVDVPLDVLPGRDKVLSDFVSKVIFRGGALAGVAGRAGVRVKVDGVEGEVGLEGLPVRGEVVIGKPR